MSTRIIPRLDIKGANLVKGIHLEGLRVLGKPELFARHYYEQGADELFCMDVVASLYERNSILSIIETISREIFIPMTVGGGLRTIADIREALKAGADKVALNTAAVRRPELIREGAEEFGSSTIVLSIEAKQQRDGTYEAYTDCGRERTGLEAVSWAERGVELGAGELIITSVDREGTGAGYDVSLMRTISERVHVPVIACGGAGSLEHIETCIQDGQADAISCASILHYKAIEAIQANANGIAPKFAGGAPTFSRVTLPEIKRYLHARGIDCRIAEGAGA